MQFPTLLTHVFPSAGPFRIRRSTALAVLSVAVWLLADGGARPDAEPEALRREVARSAGPAAVPMPDPLTDPEARARLYRYLAPDDAPRFP